MNDKGTIMSLVPLILVIVITFALIFVGVYVNDQIDSTLTSSFTGTNTATGGVQDFAKYANHSGAAAIKHGWFNITLNCTAGAIDNDYRYNFSIWSDTLISHINVSINGNTIAGMENVQLGADTGVNASIWSMVNAGNISATATILNFNYSVNATLAPVNISAKAYTASYYTDTDWRGAVVNRTVSSSGNITDSWNTNLGVIQVTIIISILATAIGAIFLFTKFKT